MAFIDKDIRRLDIGVIPSQVMKMPNRISYLLQASIWHGLSFLKDSRQRHPWHSLHKEFRRFRPLGKIKQPGYGGVPDLTKNSRLLFETETVNL